MISANLLKVINQPLVKWVAADGGAVTDDD
jgi:hypothetical protein